MTFKAILFNDADIRFGFTRAAGAYAISTELQKNGFETLVVNYSLAIDFEKFKRIINLSLDQTTLIVGFSVCWMDSQMDVYPESQSWEEKSISINFKKKNIKPYVDYIKNINPNVKIIVGGFNADRYIKEEYIDNVFIGYSESQITQYMKMLVSNCKVPKIINFDTKAKNFNFNSSSLEYTKYDLINPEEIFFIEFGRGCIFKCSFCSFPFIGSKTVDYLKYKEVMYQELLSNYERWGIKHYFIVDDTFNDSVEKLKLISEVIEELPFKPTFGAYIRIDLLAAHPEMTELLKKIGITYAHYGIETWNADTAKIIKKGGPQQRKIEALKNAKKCWGDNTLIAVSLIIGLPNDTTESFENFIEWYDQEGWKYIDNVAIAPLYLAPSNNDPYKIFVSDIDLNAKEYGYEFPDSEKIDPYVDFHGVNWVKMDKDTGDIRSRDQALSLQKNYLKRIESIQQRVFGLKSYSPVGILDLMSNLKKKFNITSTKREDVIRDLFEIDYYPRLMKLLEERKQND